MSIVTGFTKSDEGVAQYAKIGKPYPNEVFDNLYEKWLTSTTAEDLSKYTPHTEKEVTSIQRHKLGDDKEFIVYSFIHYRIDEALNVKHFWRPNIGIYPIPQAIYGVNVGSFGKQERYLQEIVNIEKGYSIPFSREKMDEIKSIGLERQGKVSYVVQLSNGLRISVRSFEDLRDGDFNELAHFGKIPNEVQRQKWIAENGLENDKELQQKVLRQRVEGDIPQRSVTAEEVRDIIRQQQQEQHSEDVEKEEEEEEEKSTKPKTGKK